MPRAPLASTLTRRRVDDHCSAMSLADRSPSFHLSSSMPYRDALLSVLSASACYGHTPPVALFFGHKSNY
jgi:hypothetical protein